MKQLTFQETLNIENKIYIDVRSPAEYAVDHIPGAVNIPILDNVERETIGKIYKNQGGFYARKKGVEIVSPKLTFLIDKLIRETKSFENIIFYCARGGLRSFSMASFFKLVVDKTIFTIEKGYKGFRNFIIDYFDNFSYNGIFLVVDGYTGSGKTLILKKLIKKGYPVIDLESLAMHRGSVFGGVGISEKVSQKKFESMLWDRLASINEKIIMLEGESKHIGKCLLPNKFYEKMSCSPHIWIETNDDLRVKIIKQDYLKDYRNIEELIEPIVHLKRFIGKNNVKMLIEEMRNKNFDFVILFLLKNYYDILYKKGRLPEENFLKKIFFKSIEEGVEKVEEVFNELKKEYPDN